MIMAPFEVYCEYLALKLHFSNPKYDYFKYNKKVYDEAIRGLNEDLKRYKKNQNTNN